MDGSSMITPNETDLYRILCNAAECWGSPDDDYAIQTFLESQSGRIKSVDHTVRVLSASERESSDRFRKSLALIDGMLKLHEGKPVSSKLIETASEFLAENQA